MVDADLAALYGVPTGALNQAVRPEMMRMFGVVRLSLFGSAARDELREDSDIDVLVEFTAAVTYTRYMGLKFFLEDLLSRQVDLVTTKALRPKFRLAVEQEAISVA